MRLRATFFIIGVAALSAISSLAAPTGSVVAEEPLRWKFAVGQKFDYKMVLEMGMSTGSDENNARLHQEIDMIWDVQGVDMNTGDAVIRQKFARLKTKLTSRPLEFEYDSKSEAAPTGKAAALAPLFKELIQNEFEITMTSRGEVKDVKIPEEVLTALKSSLGAAAVGEVATAEGFKKMITKGALVLPENPPKEGDSWKTVVEMDNPVGGKQTVETTYRYTGTKDVEGTTFAVIKPQLKLDYSANPEAGAGQSQQQVTMKVAEQSSDGEVLFNIKEGRLYAMSLQLKVTVDATANGQTSQEKIDQKIEVKLTPAAEKAEAKDAAKPASDEKAAK